MDRSEAISKLEDSFKKPCATPNTSQLPYEEFLTKEKDKLLSLVIEPIKVSAYAGAWAREYGVFKCEENTMYVIAGTKNSWLLYNPENGHFALANGNPSGRLELVGFSSSDALAEWRG